MAVKLGEIIKVIEALAPREIAEDWDNVGLQVGSYRQKVKRVLLTLDVTPKVIEEGILKEVDLIISHHPYIFKGLKNISSDNIKGDGIVKLIKNDIALYVAHTNLDKSEMGLNAFLAQKLGLENVVPLEPSNHEIFYKLVVFVPTEATERIIEVLGKYGAGAIGNYDYCTYRVLGDGTFRPLEGSNPTIGKHKELIQVNEDRVESIIPKAKLKTILAQVKKAHPYEEMAYDVYPLENGKLLPIHGNGKIGTLSEEMSGDAFIDFIKAVFDVKILKGAGKIPKTVKKVGICSGAGADLIGIAKNWKADVFITGDLKHHDGQRAEEMNLWVIDAGHYGTEKWVMACLTLILNRGFGSETLDLISSEAGRDYFTIY